jgi:nucleotide-binding universal stress UspA family protein
MPQDTIVVGVDDSPRARAAVRWAAELARRTGATLTGVHVLQWATAGDPYGYSVVSDRLYPDPDALEPLFRTPSEMSFGEVEPEPGWTLRFAHGYAGHVLVEESKDARMLVVGARVRGGVRRLLTGSVTQYCLRYAACPVISVQVGTSPAAVPSAQRRGLVAEPARYS